MTMKPNPGCDIPPIQTPPALKDIMDKIAKQTALDLAAMLLPGGVAAKTQARALEIQNDMTADLRSSIDTASKYQQLVTSYLTISCPLPPVPDKEAKIPTP